MHDSAGDHDPGEDFVWPAGADLDSLPDSLLGEITGVSRDELPHYLLELKAILWDHFRPGKDTFPTIKVVRSKHVKDIIRQNPRLFPHLAALSDREILRVASMILRDMQQQVLNNKNRGKFLVTPQGVQ